MFFIYYYYFIFILFYFYFCLNFFSLPLACSIFSFFRAPCAVNLRTARFSFNKILPLYIFRILSYCHLVCIIFYFRLMHNVREPYFYLS